VDIANTRVPPDAAQVVTELYAEHALGLVRLAYIMLGDQAAAEDVVQDAFVGLYRRWDSLPDTSHPLAYVRASVLNGCRSALRRQSRHGLAGVVFSQPLSESAEARALVSEEYRAVVTAIRRLPRRQREALLLRYYLDRSEDEIARTMGVSRGTVKSAISRALAAIGRFLREES
jgi:RNA polymerase sigma-70 factor (sigma-E family)